MAVALTPSVKHCILVTMGFGIAVSLWGCGTDETVSAVGPQLLDGGDTETDGEDTDDTGGVGGAGSDTGGSGPSTGATGGTPSVNDTSYVGRSCLGDNDCPGEMVCLTSESDAFLGGGPANGYCSAPCTSDLDCTGLDADAFCLAGISETTSYCILGCTPGQALGVKCQDRLDVACDTISDATESFSFCRPVCRTDEDCCSEEDGDCENPYCDLGLGVCVSEMPEGKAIGEECDPDLEVSDCASGICVSFAEGYSTCTALCTVGTVGCGNDSAQPEDPGMPMCLNVFGGSSTGDTGLCIQRCDCDGDCLHPDSLCFGGPFGDEPDGTQLFGTQGFCLNETAAEDATEEERFGIACVERDAGAMTPMDGGPSKSDSGAPAGDSGVVATDSGMMSMPVDSSVEPEPGVDSPTEAGSASDGG